MSKKSSRRSQYVEHLGANEGDYRARMKEFVKAMEPKSIAIIVSNPERTRSNDTEFSFRQSSDILYLNGFDEPESALVLSNLEGKKQTKLIMFVRAKDTMREQWTGIRAGVEGAKEHYFADEAHTTDQFGAEIAKLLAEADNVYYKFERNEHFDEVFKPIWNRMPRTLHSPEDISHGLRMIKGPEEVSLMQEAARISAQAHCAAAKRCKPGLKEYQLQATMEFVFKDNGAMAPAYGSIVANGASGWVLHYVSNQNELKDGDMVLIDAACEYQGYAADITRTYPVTGKFSEAQKEIYQLVLDAEKEAISAAQPGATLRQVHEAAEKVLRKGLVALGLLPREMKTARGERKLVEAAKAQGKQFDQAVLRTYFPHGTSHWLGLDVHDVGTNGTRSDAAKTRALEPGMVFTVEPGLYFDKNDTRVPEKYRGIAVRIEDDVLVTKNGNKVLTTGVPKEIVDIEKLMAS